MNTSTRARYATANQAHASTAHVPLLRHDGVVMPSQQRTQALQTRQEFEHKIERRLSGTHDLVCRRLAISAAYQAAITSPALREPVTPQLLTDARNWLQVELGALVAQGYWPEFVGRDSPLPESLAGFYQNRTNGQTRPVPITSQHNGPHPVWSPLENLLFRFVHDGHHYQIGAGDAFAGELAVAHHVLTPAVRKNGALARFLASEIIGQAAVTITTGAFPQQIIARNILDLI